MLNKMNGYFEEIKASKYQQKKKNLWKIGLKSEI